VLYNFTNFPNQAPHGGPLTLVSNTLYGIDSQGGDGEGVVFRFDIGSSDFTNLYAFDGSDALSPNGSMILGGKIYGTALGGGTGGSGTIFSMNTDGSGYTNLHNFSADATSWRTPETNADGIRPHGYMVVSDGVLYGVTEQGGTNGSGTIFSMNADGSGFTNIHFFSPSILATNSSGQYYYTNSDGFAPMSSLTLLGNTLYGWTPSGGLWSYGCIFRLNTDGSGFTNIHNFIDNSVEIVGNVGPLPSLVVSGNTLFGSKGNSYNGGDAIFKINTDGSGFTTLYTFTNGVDGATPGQLILSGNTLYGVAQFGGSNAWGTIFQLNTDGSDFNVLFTFQGPAPGSYDPVNATGFEPVAAGLVLSGNVLYGQTVGGGNPGYGVLYALTLPVPALAITSSAIQVVLSWPAAPGNFALESTAALSSGVWATVTNGIATDGTNNFFTTPITAQNAFFHLVPQP
jgi:uncharacterized repeat protein (TIGR03803 family)